MNLDALTQVGIGGIFVVLVLRIVLIDFLGKGNGKHRTGTVSCEDIAELLALTKELYDWHKPNDDGEQNWKNTSMIKLLEKIEVTISQNTKVIERVLSKIN